MNSQTLRKSLNSTLQLEFNSLINVKMKEQLMLETDYDISIFEDSRTESSGSFGKSWTIVRISPLDSPRIKYYQDQNYITPPGTPRSLNGIIDPMITPRDMLIEYCQKNTSIFFDDISKIILGVTQANI